MTLMHIRAVPGASLQLVGDVTDLDSRSHEVQVHFPHERVDSYKTTFGPDCFRDSFSEQLPIMVWAHDLRDPIGRGIKAQVLPTHNEVVGRFSDLEAVPSARRAYAQIEDGTITDFSFGYVNGPERPHPDPALRRRGVRQIPKATMREFSPVSIGSIPGANVAGVREDGNIVTADSPETVAKLVELKVLTPEEGAGMLRSLGYLDGTRAAGDGVPWDTASAVAHLQEAHGIDVYRAGLAASVPNVMLMVHQQMAGEMMPTCQPWQLAAQALMAHAMANGGGTTLSTGIDQAEKDRQVAALGYNVHPGVGAAGGPGATASAIPGSLEPAKAAGAGYQVTSGGTPPPPGWRADPGLFDDLDDGPLRADQVMEHLERTHPLMAMKLRDAKLALAPADMDILFRDDSGTVIDGATGEEVSGPDGFAAAPETAQLAANVDAALDSARQWLEGADVDSLPEEVRQALALVAAAADGSDTLVELLGGQRDAQDGDADSGYSSTPWEQFDQSDFTPEQWKSSCLIDKGDGDADSKSRYALPIKEPSGKVNKHAVAAAASRIGAVKGAPDSEVRSAAKTLMSHYGRMKKPVPPAVLKITGQGQREEQDEFEAARALLESRLAGHRAR